MIKEVISAPHLSCILQHTQLQADREILSQLKLYAICAPHLEVGGWGNNAHVVQAAGQEILVAQKGEIWLALGATVPFSRLSCGYVGQSDGWTDLADNFQMDWEFDCAMNGNIALTGELNLEESHEFTLGLAFGDSLHAAISTLFQALNLSFQEQKQQYMEQWKRSVAVRRTSRSELHPLDKVSGDGGCLFHGGVSVLLAHEDKTYPGAMIASLSIPWGETKGDKDRGGYHLVWTRDLVSSVAGLVAAGETDTAM